MSTHTHDPLASVAHCRECLAFVADVRERDRQLDAWMTEHKTRSYFPHELPATLTPPTNEERGRAELIEFFTQPLAHGVGYFAYLHSDRKSVTTFMGNTLAEITTRKQRANSRGWMTNERGAFWARGIDGRTYYGRDNGPGMYCRMRLAKHQPKEQSK